MKLDKPDPSSIKRYFVSYCHKSPADVELAQFLARGISAAGHEAFIDTNMAVGSDWVKEIGRHIGHCDFLIVLISENVLGNEMVQGEIRLAHKRVGKKEKPRILPVRVAYEGPLDYELDIYLARIHYLNWKNVSDSAFVLEKILALPLGDENTSLAEATAPTCFKMLGQLEEAGRPVPTVDPRAFSAPGGTLRPNDRFYLERISDELAMERASLEGETLVIKAPRQHGKSSLLLRYLATCRSYGKRIVLIDFSVLSDLEMRDYPCFLREVAELLAQSLKSDSIVPPIKSQAELTRYLERVLLPEVRGPLVLAFDEVDRILGRPFQTDFFTMLRMWHNLRASFESPWEQVDLALVISTEPYLLIDSADRSPFNVTQPIEIPGFSFEHYEELNCRYGEPLLRAEVGEIYELLGGHPYLTRLAFYRLVAADRMSVRKLIASSASDESPFGDHLRALLLKISGQRGLCVAMRDIITHGTAIDAEAYERLHGCGLARRDGRRVVASNMLYGRFFGRILK